VSVGGGRGRGRGRVVSRRHNLSKAMRLCFGYAVYKQVSWVDKANFTVLEEGQESEAAIEVPVMVVQPR